MISFQCIGYALHRSFNLAFPHFPHLYKRDKNIFSLDLMLFVRIHFFLSEQHLGGVLYYAFAIISHGNDRLKKNTQQAQLKFSWNPEYSLGKRK